MGNKGTKWTLDKARNRGRRDRRLKYRALAQCPFTHVGRRAAWEAGWREEDARLSEVRGEEG